MENILRECVRLNDYERLRIEFKPYFSEVVDTKQIAIAVSLYKKIVREFVPNFDVQKCDDRIRSAISEIKKGVYKFKDSPKALSELVGVNTVYYWDPYYVVSIEMTLCCDYKSNRDKGFIETNFYFTGHLEPVTLEKLSDIGFPKVYESVDYKICEEYLHLALFSAQDELLKECGLSSVPFSISTSYGVLNAERQGEN